MISTGLHLFSLGFTVNISKLFIVNSSLAVCDTQLKGYSGIGAEFQNREGGRGRAAKDDWQKQEQQQKEEQNNLYFFRL